MSEIITFENGSIIETAPLQEQTIRAKRIDFGDIYELSDIPNQIIYRRQSDLEYENYLYLRKGFSKFVTRDYNSQTRFLITKITYKSNLHKWFRWFLKTPIKSIKIMSM